MRGRVVDTAKQSLPGASIYIEKLHTGVTSDHKLTFKGIFNNRNDWENRNWLPACAWNTPAWLIPKNCKPCF